ncbi:MAG TPA: hypothetical protein VNF69_05150 [Burkholderiales bacterium]|nr:hypothetical protein [Burkholderiales bacterium]
MAKPNYQMEKRQRDLKKKRKQEEKRLRKLALKKGVEGGDAESPSAAPESTPPEGAAESGDLP